MQMQLFVIPVTEAFLYEANDARIKEFALAKEHHIPILPILVDSGLAGDFNRICGNIQFLDRTSTDVTEIPYMEKLKNLSGARVQYEAILPLSEQAVSCSGAVEAKRALSSYYSRLAQNYGYVKDTQKEKLYYQKSFEVDRQIAEETGSLEDQNILASDYQKMSFHANAGEDYEAAEAYQRKSIEISERAVAAEPSVPRYRKSLTLSQNLDKEDISDRAQWEMAGKYLDLADSCYDEGNWSKAQSYYQSYTDIYERMAEKDPTKDNIIAYDFAMYRYRCLIEICLLQKDFDEAKHYAGIYHEMAKQMPGRFTAASSFMGVSLNEYMGSRLRMLLQIYTKCADSCKKEEDYAHAKAAYEEAIGYGEEFVKTFPGDRDGRNRLALANYYYGDVMPDSYYISYLREALEIWEQLAEEDPQTQSYAHNADVVRRIVEE